MARPSDVDISGMVKFCLPDVLRKVESITAHLVITGNNGLPGGVGRWLDTRASAENASENVNSFVPSLCEVTRVWRVNSLQLRSAE